MGKHLDAFERQLTATVAESEAKYPGNPDLQRCHQLGTLIGMARINAAHIDAITVVKADEKLPTSRASCSKVEIVLDDVRLTVKGSYTPGEAPSIDSDGEDAEFEIHGIYAGSTYMGDLLNARDDEIAELALAAYESDREEFNAAAQYDKRRAA